MSSIDAGKNIFHSHYINKTKAQKMRYYVNNRIFFVAKFIVEIFNIWLIYIVRRYKSVTVRKLTCCLGLYPYTSRWLQSPIIYKSDRATSRDSSACQLCVACLQQQSIIVAVIDRKWSWNSQTERLTTVS